MAHLKGHTINFHKKGYSLEAHNTSLKKITRYIFSKFKCKMRFCDINTWIERKV